MAQETGNSRENSRESRPMRPGKNGGMLRTGGRNTAAGGRPPNWLKDWCDEILRKPECREQVEKILNDANHDAFAQMWRAVADRAHGKPVQAVEHGGGITVEVVHVDEDE